MRYLKETTNVCLWYPKGILYDMIRYSNSNYVGFKTDRKAQVKRFT